LKIVMDCANGAAYRVAPAVLWELGATVIPVGASPDGLNINRGCGATMPDLLCAQVREHQADLGLALDGDADRVLIADETGALVDGDQVLAIIARTWQHTGRLRGEAIAATVMSNLGLERFLAARGIALHRTAVGDRYVAERMRESGLNVGGEQSGHVILSDYAATGDGLVAALEVLRVLVEEGRRASEVCHVFEPMPQCLKNVHFRSVSPLLDQRVQRDIAEARAMLAGCGRVLIRESGTEPVVRVMAEVEDASHVVRVVDFLCSSLAEAARLG
jgi:phosphoglucosamine mutase